MGPAKDSGRELCGRVGWKISAYFFQWRFACKWWKLDTVETWIEPADRQARTSIYKNIKQSLWNLLVCYVTTVGKSRSGEVRSLRHVVWIWESAYQYFTFQYFTSILSLIIERKAWMWEQQKLSKILALVKPPRAAWHPVWFWNNNKITVNLSGPTTWCCAERNLNSDLKIKAPAILRALKVNTNF